MALVSWVCLVLAVAQPALQVTVPASTVHLKEPEATPHIAEHIPPSGDTQNNTVTSSDPATPLPHLAETLPPSATPFLTTHTEHIPPSGDTQNNTVTNSNPATPLSHLAETLPPSATPLPYLDEHIPPSGETQNNTVTSSNPATPLPEPLVSSKSLKSLGKGKPQNGTTLCLNGAVVPCSSINQNYGIDINESSPCVFRCSYNPLQLSPLRLEVHLHYKRPMLSPTFVSVQQDYYLTSWTLPIILPAKGEAQKFSTIETILCPPANESREVVQVTLSVRGPDLKHLQFALKNVSFILQKEVNVTVTVTPVSPWYKRYLWQPGEESVLVTATSDPQAADICGLLILQNAECPVSSELSGLVNRGRYQTFTQQAGMVVRKEEFPAGVHIIVVSLPDDNDCLLNPQAEGHNNTHTSRTKSVVLEVYSHATLSETWYIFLLTGGVVGAIATAAAVVVVVVTNRTLGSALGSEDETPLLGVAGETSDSHSQSAAQSTPPAGLGKGLYGDLGQEELDDGGGGGGGGGGCGGGVLAIDNREANDPRPECQALVPVQPPAFLPSAPLSPAFLPPTLHKPPEEALNISNSFNPHYVLWWKSVAVHESSTAEAQVSEVGFQNSLVIMGVFAALPTTELLKAFLGMVLHDGREDQCFWNSRCLTALGSLPDFSRVFTNIGYILLGLAYFIVVRNHRSQTHAILQHYPGRNSVGVSRHYGLYTSLAYGLVIQGVMSALYHICPNSVTIKFDMMFMFVLLVVSVVIVWGQRHSDVTHHVYPTVIGVGLALLLAEAREWMSAGWFWGLLSCVYTVLLLSNAVLMSSYGIWSFSLTKLWHVWSGWRPVGEKLRQVLGEQDTSVKPMTVVRVLVGVGANLALIVFGFLADPEIYNYILIVCLVNLALYFANYVLVKRLSFGERGTVLAWVCLLLSVVLWVIALAFFFQRRTDSESSPADSRSKNSRCDFLYVFDQHDIWHLTSAFALFFFFVALLTMDDDLCRKPSCEIYVT